jgi:hypothetical protein
MLERASEPAASAMRLFEASCGLALELIKGHTTGAERRLWAAPPAGSSE